MAVEEKERRERLEWLVRASLEEDRASRDITTDATLRGERGTAEIRAEAEGVIAGIEVLETVFMVQDPSLKFTAFFRDGARVNKDDLVATIEGNLTSILKAERTALNFLMHLSGVATSTARYVEALEGTSVTLLDTRKTIPLLRDLQKAAVRAGGGVNHRRNLEEMLLLKSNHIRAVGSLTEAVRRVRERYPGRFLEVEVRNLSELMEALKLPIDRVMLDNFSPEEAAEATRTLRKMVPVEVSGGINLETIRQYALNGVDFISVGAITQSAPALPFSLKITSVDKVSSPSLQENKRSAHE